MSKQKDPIESFFPQVRVENQPSTASTDLSFPLSKQQWLVLEKNSLTEREHLLLDLLTTKRDEVRTNPWYRYLVEQQEKVPSSAQKIQFIHCHLFSYENETVSSWLEMMRSLLVNRLGDFQLGDSDYIFVVDQSLLHPLEDFLSDVLPTLEYDFNLKLAIVLGQMWHQSLEDSYADLFQAEHLLCERSWELTQQSSMQSFSTLFLWSLGQGIEISSFLKKKLRQLIDSQDQLVDTIFALWKHGAVVTKAAQALYIHRNTLQYRMEKCEELTGLNLRELTDLALCYHLVLSDLF